MSVRIIVESSSNHCLINITNLFSFIIVSLMSLIVTHEVGAVLIIVSF